MCIPMCEVFLQGRHQGMKLPWQKIWVYEMLMVAANVFSKVAVLFNYLSLKSTPVPIGPSFLQLPFPPLLFSSTFPLSVPVSYLPFSLMLPGLFLCCSFYLSKEWYPYCLRSTVNFYSDIKTHLGGHNLCEVFLNLPPGRQWVIPSSLLLQWPLVSQPSSLGKWEAFPVASL